MDKYGYTIKKKSDKKVQKKYTKDELNLLTTHGLREICREEKIISKLSNPLDKDELIRLISKFRSADDKYLIKNYDEKSYLRLNQMLMETHRNYVDHKISGCAKLVCYQGLSIEYFDNFTISYKEELEGTNAILVSGNTVCSIFNIELFDNEKEVLHITKTKQMFCSESDIKNYMLYCFDKQNSKLIYDIYMNEQTFLPKQVDIYPIEVLNFNIRNLLNQNMSLAIDFGTSSTSAGMYLDSNYFEKLENDPVKRSLIENEINYVRYIDEDNEEHYLCPSMVGVNEIIGSNIDYIYGHAAKKIANTTYIDGNLSIFYDIKRWISDYNKLEEVVDKRSNRGYTKRKHIIANYINYIIEESKQRFKCDIKDIHITTPVKQKGVFVNLFDEILEDYTFESSIDEGVAVLYNSISTLMTRGDVGEKKALVIDCGGGTTDLSSLNFSIENKRVSYKIDIDTTYENGDTDFGGNNLTFRIMQLIKISLCDEFADTNNLHEVLSSFDLDIFRATDEDGIDFIYKKINDIYALSEKIIPTSFKDYEHRNRSDYYKVKNNFYYLFELAEEMKKLFYGNKKALRVALSPSVLNEMGVVTIRTAKWKLSIKEDGEIETIKDFPSVYFNIHDIGDILRADIYNIVKKFIEKMYLSEELFEYSIIKLTGQSCKVDIFKEALKEFVPGKVIEFRNNSKKNNENELKLICLDGAIKFLRDKKYGYADITIKGENSSLPYAVSVLSHTGKEVKLIDGAKKDRLSGNISRNIENLTLRLMLKDSNLKDRYEYNYECNVTDFSPVTYEEIYDKYNTNIYQDDVDDIVNDEVKFFVYADLSKWGFNVLPILRKEDSLMIGVSKFYMFENESWVCNFFDGMK